MSGGGGKEKIPPTSFRYREIQTTPSGNFLPSFWLRAPCIFKLFFPFFIYFFKRFKSLHFFV
jgi:hypothetical protein